MLFIVNDNDCRSIPELGSEIITLTSGTSRPITLSGAGFISEKEGPVESNNIVILSETSTLP